VKISRAVGNKIAHRMAGIQTLVWQSSFTGVQT